MKRIFLAFMILCVMASCACADVEISAANFPDDIFRAWVRENLDDNNDGILVNEDLEYPAWIDVQGLGISSLKGIEFLTGMISLNCENNNLTGTLDLSNNTALTWVSCMNNQLESLNITGCMDLESVNCRENQLTGTLDLSGRTKLRNVNCRINKLEQLIITGCMALVEINCRNNELTGTLDLSGRTALKNVWCQNNHFERINVTGCTALEELNCTGNWRAISAGDYEITRGIEALDVSTCTALRKLYCHHGSLTQLDVSKNLLLEELDCGDNWLANESIKTLDISNNVNLTYLNCEYNNIDVLDVSRNVKLAHLNCGNNNLHELNLQNNTALEYLAFQGSYLTEIDLSRNTALKELYCFVNELQNLDLTNNTNLEVIECYRNELTALGLTGHTLLKQDEAVIKSQIARELNIAFDADNVEYPYSLNLNDYMTSSQISGVIASTVMGLNDKDEEISSTYSNDIIRFSEYPVKVKYNYGTGLNNLSMDVMITSGDTYTGVTTHDNHVYRIFTENMTWQEAKTYCESLGGHLLTITSKEEHDVIERMLADAYHTELGVTHKASSCFMVGGERRDDDEWYWITGEKITDTDSSATSSGELSTTGSRHLLITFMGNYYVHVGDNTRGYFICEWDSVSVDAAPLSEQFMLYSADPEAYYDGIEFYGEIPEPTDLSHLTDNPPVNGSVFSSATLPSKYDLRDYGYTTSIKSQNPYGTCWAFASIGALESNYLVQNGGTAPDLSELHLAWYVFRDPRQGYSFPLNDPDQEILNQGGFHSMPIAMFSRMAGPALESDLPYSRASNVSTLTSNRTPESYTRPFKLKDAYTLGEINASNRDIVKNLVINHGAVEIAYLHEQSEMRGSAYYNPSNITNHAVEIIGWDDNYSRSNFKNQPASNGAWLIRNSWGEYGEEKGCFWMSYEQYISGAVSYVIEDSTEYMKHYGYDELGSISSIPHQWSANVFKAQDNEEIVEVGFYTRDNNARYTIYINRLGSEIPVNPGAISSPVISGTMTNAGYHTLTLTSPIEVKKDEYFSVILRIEKSSSYNYVSAVESRFSGCVVNEGESYFASSNSPVSSDWIDGKRIITGPFNACVKAFTVPTETPSPVDVKPSITSSNLPDGKVNTRYSFTLTATGTTPIIWSVSGLPNGLRLNNATITGTPTTEGSYNVSVSARNSAGSDAKTFTLTISANDSGNTGGGGGGGCSSLGGISLLAVLYVFTKKK